MTTVHIEGMGLTGSMLAVLLDQHGIEFTWHDIDLDRVAWPASTGAIYPSGSTKFGPDEECREVWAGWHDIGLFGPVLERSLFVFSTKSAPHGGRYSVQETVDGLRIAGESSYHLNAQQLVKATRERFADRRAVKQHGDVDTYIVAHGWGSRLSHVYWGWMRLVELDYDQDTYGYSPFMGGGRPAFYFREGRFIMAYAYPVPNTPYWYAGSNIIKQAGDARRSLDMPGKYARWKDNFERLGNGGVAVKAEHGYIEGWRPAAAKDDEAWIRRSGNVLTVRPLWNSGIRHFPKQWVGIAHQLAIPFLATGNS